MSILSTYPNPKSQEEDDRNRMKRMEVNDPFALREEGTRRFKKGDYKSAFEYWTKAAELGDIVAPYKLSILYWLGGGVEKDERKKVYHLEEAAIAGHLEARHNLGCHEWSNNDNAERAVKHFIIAANLGLDLAIEVLHGGYAAGMVSKEDFAAALRAHQAASVAMKSPLREAAEEYQTAVKAAGS